ncbi:MAG: MepB family protein [Pseudobdellovibrio sp.]
MKTNSAIYREAKITPTKNGQFVTVWKRNSKGLTAPYDTSNKIDFYIITVKTKTKSGQFTFPKEVLIKQGIMSVKGKGGKRGLRVYPPWDKPQSKQAEKTQRWQLDYFSTNIQV